MRCRPEQWGYLIFNTKEMTDLIEWIRVYNNNPDNDQKVCVS
ncbi:erythromycin esterase family protein [Paenibacillus elgii]|nr:erythromycin esterase family protein [Paenibacillus elgii]